MYKVQYVCVCWWFVLNAKYCIGSLLLISLLAVIESKRRGKETD